MLFEDPLFTIILCCGYIFYKRIRRHLNPQSFVSKLCLDVITDLTIADDGNVCIFSQQPLNLATWGLLSVQTLKTPSFRHRQGRSSEGVTAGYYSARHFGGIKVKCFGQGTVS